MLYPVNVLKWQSHRDSKKRVSGKYNLTGREFLLNLNRVEDLTVLSSYSRGNSFSHFRFTENRNDRRENWDYLEVQKRTSELITGRDAVPASLFITLPVFPKSDSTKATVNTTLELEDIVYVDDANQRGGYSWVVYITKGFRRKEVLVDLTATEVFDLISNPLLDRDGNAYTTMTIGTQEWIVQSLRTTTYADGTDIPYITNNVDWLADTTGAQCCLYHDWNIARVLGHFYNWYAVNNAHGLIYFTRNGVQEVGWRVPTVNDFDTLSLALGGDAVSGGALRETGDFSWSWPEEATDTSGFRAMGSGNRSVDDHTEEGWDSVKVFFDTWTSVEVDVDHANSIYLTTGSEVFEDWNHEKYGGMVVRAVRDI